jgi:hypothetical protein
MKADEMEKRFQIQIRDNSDWQPDQVFHVELYDCDSEGFPRLFGDDTKCKVTILDEDFPGSLAFEETQVNVLRKE